VPTIGLLSEQVCDEIPASHRDLVQCPPVAALTTGMADDSPQTSVVCRDFDGQRVRVNTMRGFVKERNMRRNPRVTLWCTSTPGTAGGWCRSSPQGSPRSAPPRTTS
jgi:hypothetical protein